MKLRSVPFLLGEAWHNLRRHALMTGAAICAIAVALTLVGAFALAFHAAQGAAKQVASGFEMRVFVRRAVPRARAQRLVKRIAALPGVGAVTFLSSETVFAAQARVLELDVSGIPNFMPDTLNVRLADAREGATVSATVRQFAEVESVAAMDDELRTLLRLGGIAQTVGYASGVVLLLAALAVVSNTIRLSVFSRRREIKIMQIVGASAAFIRLPLLLEGLMHGVAGAVLATVALRGAAWYVGDLVTGSLPQFALVSAPVDFGAVTLGLLAGGAILGGAGAVLSIRRYLRG